MHTGGLGVREELIVGYVNIVASLATKFSKTYPSIGDEFFAEGLLALVRASDRFLLHGYDTNFGGYAYTKIRCGMLDLLRKRIEGQLTEKKAERIPWPSSVLWIDFFDCLNKEEEQVVRLLIRGETVNEVAEQMGVSVSYLYRNVFPEIKRKACDG